MTGDAGLLSLPPETYRQPVVLVCGDMSAHLFTDSPVRQVSEGLYLHVSDEEQLVAQVERLLTLRPAWASQLAVAYTVMPGMYRDDGGSGRTTCAGSPTVWRQCVAGRA